MLKESFPILNLKDWRETRDTLLKYCRLVGAIRETLSLPLPHSLHTNLLVCRNGFTTSAIQKTPLSKDHTFEVIIDLINRKLRIESNFREPMYVALTGQSLSALCDETCSLLNDIGVKTPLEKPSFLDGIRGHINADHLKKYWKASKFAAKILKNIKKEIVGRTSPVQLRPDDLSLNLNWFGDELTPNKNILFEQVEFGFSTGDENVPEAYFYVSTFPSSEFLERLYNGYAIIKPEAELKLSALPVSKLLKYISPQNEIIKFFKKLQPLFNFSG